MQAGADDVVVADFDGDGINDIATSNADEAGPATSDGTA